MTNEQDLDEQLDPAESELGERLRTQRPVPGAGFRGSLGRWLDQRDPGFGPRPRQLVPIVVACTGSGLALIGLAALSATGAL
jgi:hypothetical protein